ncbi:reverse transcriptase domain-containing protein [Tanacetum coccineum]
MQKEKEQQDKLNATPTARTEPKKRHGSRRSRSLSPVASVFKRLKQNRPPSPRPRPRKEGGMFNRLGGKEQSASACSDSRHHVLTAAICTFDKLPRESIDSYEDLRKAFRENYLQQTKHIKDPVEIHHIKQRDGESMEDFMERYKAKILDVEGVPECMKIAGFMHGITHPKLIKHLYKKILRLMDEMYRVTTSFLQGEVAAFSHNTGHNTDECMQLRKQIDEMIKSGEKDGTEGPMIIEAEIGGHLASARNKKPDDPSYYVTHRIQWRNHLADRSDIPTSKDSLVARDIYDLQGFWYRVLDEKNDQIFCFSFVDVCTAKILDLNNLSLNNDLRGHKDLHKKDLCRIIHCTRNVKNPGKRRNVNNTKQQSHPDGMCNDLRT